MEKNSRVEIGRTPAADTGKTSRAIRDGDAVADPDAPTADSPTTEAGVSKVASLSSFGHDRLI